MRQAVLAILLTIALGHGQVLGAELFLKEQPRTDVTDFGWTFLVLSATTLVLSAKYLSDSQDNLDLADQSYTSYKSATSPTDITNFRNDTTRYHNDAISLERRANIGIYLSILFGVVSYYSFYPESLPDSPVLVSLNGIIIRHRF